MSKDLHDHVKDHFERMSPDADRLQQLVDMAALKKQTPPFFQHWQWAAVLPLLVLLGGLWFERDVQPRGAMVADIAQEIVANHEKHPTPDVYAESYAALAAALGIDNLSISPPTLWSDPSYRLVGGVFAR